MIEAKVYFNRYLSWTARMVDSQHGNKTQIYCECYPTMDLEGLQEEAEFDNPGAMEELGERYLYGLNSLPQDTDRAVEWLQKAADLGHPDAYFMLADIHRTDDFGQKDLDLYFSLLPQAAEAGSWNALYNLACALYKGRDAYEGHGYDADHAVSLDMSLMGAKVMIDLLNVYTSRTCSTSFEDYFGRLYTCLIQIVSAAVKQMVTGDGCDKDPERAKALIADAANAAEKYKQTKEPRFDWLMKKCEEA